MARPRTFDEDQAIQKAMLVFWRHGYDATTYQMIEKATGVGRRSLFNIFGDKDALFVRVLKIYRENAAGLISQLFNPPNAEAIITLFGSLGQPRDDPDPANAGCLMVNTVFELGRSSDPVRAEVDIYREMWRGAFQSALEASNTVDAAARAEFLLGLLWGALSQIRLSGQTSAAAPMAKVAIETIEAWLRDQA